MNMVLVSIIMPMFNASQYLREAFQSILDQTWKDSLELSIFNDASSDDSALICQEWVKRFRLSGIVMLIAHNDTGSPQGVGFAKNKAIQQSSGEYLCFFDSDDIMLPQRIELQLEQAKTDHSMIVGSCYTRMPIASTYRYTAWSNNLTQEQLYTQIYTSFGPTLINPTWFCSRKVFNIAGMFLELKKGFPEDLDFFYRHLECSGKLFKIGTPLIIYRYHKYAASFNVHENTIWELRVQHLQKNVLPLLRNFTIWNAGKQGRKFYRSLNEENRKKATAMCDVDKKKLDKKYYHCEVFRDGAGKPILVPIVHFKDALPPFIICVKLNLTNGVFERNLDSLNLVEGRDYYHFS